MWMLCKNEDGPYLFNLSNGSKILPAYDLDEKDFQLKHGFYIEQKVYSYPAKHDFHLTGFQTEINFSCSWKDLKDMLQIKGLIVNLKEASEDGAKVFEELE